MSAIINPHVSDYWVKFYVNTEQPMGLCSLCGNTGVIDTRQTARSPNGSEQAGRLNWCICPNGQHSRRSARGKPPTLAYKEQGYTDG